jgi:hypothetical protein
LRVKDVYLRKQNFSNPVIDIMLKNGKPKLNFESKKTINKSNVYRLKVSSIGSKLPDQLKGQLIYVAMWVLCHCTICHCP